MSSEGTDSYYDPDGTGRYGSGATRPLDSLDFQESPAPGDARHPGRRGMRVGTIVWGLVLISLAALLLAVRLTDIRLDAGLVALGLIIGAGTALVVGGLLSALGRRNQAE